MADNRKYYYLKLKESYFDDDAIVLLESMPDGILYSNILLKLYLCRPQETRGTFGLSIPYRIRAGILPPIPRSSRKRAYWRAVRQAALSLTRFLEAAPPGLQRKALTDAISALN